MTALRHEFYETEERLTLSVFDRGADPLQVSVEFGARKVSYINGDKTLVIEPLKGQIDPEASEFTVGKVKIEIRLAKVVLGRWGALVGDSPDPLATPTTIAPADASADASAILPRSPPKPRKNWDGIAAQILNSDVELTTDQDPNVGGDSVLNSFFQRIYGDADDDTKKAMMKSYSESGGTTLSTNWEEVRKAKVDVKPPSGSEWKKWK